MTATDCIVKWNDIVSYDEAVSLVSTDRAGTNGRGYLDALTADQCDSKASGAWMANNRESYVAHRSASAHKRVMAQQVAA